MAVARDCPHLQLFTDPPSCQLCRSRRQSMQVLQRAATNARATSSRPDKEATSAPPVQVVQKVQEAPPTTAPRPATDQEAFDQTFQWMQATIDACRRVCAASHDRQQEPHCFRYHREGSITHCCTRQPDRCYAPLHAQLPKPAPTTAPAASWPAPKPLVVPAARPAAESRHSRTVRAQPGSDLTVHVYCGCHA